MKLEYRELGKGQPLLILHGLFGSSDNWLTTGKILSEDYHVFLIDQRNHGSSPHSDEFSYPIMAKDLADFIAEHKIQNPIIMGHSMGGKVAMEYAVNNPDTWEKLIVVDIAPKAYPVHHELILDGLSSLDVNSLKSRGDADKYLSEYVPEKMVRQFLLKNLGRTSDGFDWKINLASIAKNIDIIGAQTTKKLGAERLVLFIDGENSNYIQQSDHETIHHYFPGAEIETINGAGHWVHAEKPEEFLQVLKSFLAS